MATTQLRPMAMGEILDASFALLRRHAGVFFGVAIVCQGLPTALGLFVEFNGGARGRARATPGWHRRPGTLLEPHPGVQVAGVRALHRGHRSLGVVPARFRLRRGPRGSVSSPVVRTGDDRIRPRVPLPLSVHELRVHPVLLRPARAAGGVRSRAPEPAPRHRRRTGVSVVPQQVDPDSLRAALQAVFQARDYRWSEPSSAWLWLTEQWHRLLDWLETLRVASPARYYLLLAALTLLLLAILAHVTWVVWRSLRPREAIVAPTAEAAPPRGAAWHPGGARRLGALRRFAEALAHRFLAAVLDLDGQRVLQFNPSKTPAEYAVEARLDATGRSELAALVASLYHHVFGGVPCDAEAWQRFG